jgi:hypothetical protein
MTYLKIALISSALVATTSSVAWAGPGTASMLETPAQQTSASSVKATIEDPIGKILQADGQPESDFELLTHDGDMITKSMARALDSDNNIRNNAIVVPSSSGDLTTVSCPIGTTAQVDMTCLVTGNFSLERTERLFEEEAQEERETIMTSAYEKKVPGDSEEL